MLFAYPEIVNCVLLLVLVERWLSRFCLIFFSLTGVDDGVRDLV